MDTDTLHTLTRTVLEIVIHITGAWVCCTEPELLPFFSFHGFTLFIASPPLRQGPPPRHQLISRPFHHNCWCFSSWCAVSAWNPLPGQPCTDCLQGDELCVQLMASEHYQIVSTFKRFNIWNMHPAVVLSGLRSLSSSAVCQSVPQRVLGHSVF